MHATEEFRLGARLGLGAGVGVGGGLGVGGDGGAGKSQIWQVEQLSHRPQLAQEQFRELPAPPVHTQYGGFSVKQEGAPPVTRPLSELGVLVSVVAVKLTAAPFSGW
jgi:hypothetical protein